MIGSVGVALGVELRRAARRRGRPSCRSARRRRRPRAACEMAVRASSSSVASLSTVAVGAHDAAVAVRGVLAQADVGDDEQVGVRLLDRARGELDDALVVVGARALLVLLGRDAEQQHRRDAERVRLAGLLDRVRDRQPVDARASPRSAYALSVPSWTNIG